MKIVKLNKITWKTDLGIAKYQAQNLFGIMNDEGKVLSRDGIQPCAWNAKKTVEIMLPYANEFKNHTWIEIN